MLRDPHTHLKVRSLTLTCFLSEKKLLGSKNHISWRAHDPSSRRIPPDIHLEGHYDRLSYLGEVDTVLRNAPIDIACAVLAPAVSQFNGGSVSVKVDSSMGFQTKAKKRGIYAKMHAAANQIYQRGHRIRAEYTSQLTKQTGPYTAMYQRLCLCLN